MCLVTVHVKLGAFDLYSTSVHLYSVLGQVMKVAKITLEEKENYYW